SPQTENCPRCGVDNPPGMRFCRMCGGLMAREAPAPQAAPAPALPTACPRCRAPLDRGAAFCGVCGLPTSEMAAHPGPPGPAPALMQSPPVQSAPRPSPSQPFAAPQAPPPAQPPQVAPGPPASAAVAASQVIPTGPAPGPVLQVPPQ